MKKCSDLSLEGIKIKDESRKVYLFQNDYKSVTLHSEKGKDNLTDVFWNIGDVWNNDRDSIYIFDSKNKIVYSDSYGF